MHLQSKPAAHPSMRPGSRQGCYYLGGCCCYAGLQKSLSSAENIKQRPAADSRGNRPFGALSSADLPPRLQNDLVLICDGNCNYAIPVSTSYNMVQAGSSGWNGALPSTVTTLAPPWGWGHAHTCPLLSPGFPEAPMPCMCPCTALCL